MVMQIKLVVVVVVVVVLEEHSQMGKENFEDRLVVSFLTLYGTYCACANLFTCLLDRSVSLRSFSRKNVFETNFIKT